MAQEQAEDGLAAVRALQEDNSALVLDLRRALGVEPCVAPVLVSATRDSELTDATKGSADANAITRSPSPLPNVSAALQFPTALASASTQGKSAKQHMRERKRRDAAKSELRDAMAAQAKNEIVLSHLSKMGDANGWAESLGHSTRFFPHEREDGEVTCRVYEGGTFAKELTRDLFERRFKAMKSRRCLSSSAAEREQGRMSDRRSRASPAHVSAQVRCERQEDFQKEIRRVTQETLALADQMRQQLMLLGHPCTA